MLFQGFFLKSFRHGFSFFVFASLCLGGAAYAIPLLPQGLDYAYCVVAIGRERCAAIAMSRSLCKARIEESRGIERIIDRASNDYLDALAAMNIREDDLLNSNFVYSGIVTEHAADQMYKLCPSVLKSENGDRPIVVASLETMLFGVYRQSILRVLLMEAKADADCKNQVSRDKCLRERREFYFKIFFPEGFAEPAK
jgi:hypothetical protein